MPSSLVLNPDGSATLSNVTLWFSNVNDVAETGTATITVTPMGGLATIPPLMQGDPGVPPELRNITVNTLDPATIPTPTQSASLTLVDPGGPGEPSVYDLTLNLLKGAAGPAGPDGHILGSSDFSNSPANGQVPVYDSGATKVAWQTLRPVTPLYVVPGTAFTALTESGASTRNIVVAQSIPAQSFAYRPKVLGGLEASATIGTRIDAEVRMGTAVTANSTIAMSGTLIGRGRGAESLLAVHLDIQPYFGVAMAPGDVSPAAVVPAGTAMTIVLSAVRQYGSSSWSTTQALGELQIALEPI